MIRSRSSAVRPSGARSTSYSASASVFDSRSRIAASSSTTSTRGRRPPASPSRARRRRAPRPDARPLALEPGVDVALAEPPLPADPHRRDLAGLDQPVDRAEVDLEVLEDLFGRQEAFVDHVGGTLSDSERRSRAATAIICRRRPAGSSIVNTAPPSGALRGVNGAAVLLDDAVGDASGRGRCPVRRPWW